MKKNKSSYRVLGEEILRLSAEVGALKILGMVKGVFTKVELKEAIKTLRKAQNMGIQDAKNEQK